MTTLAEGSTIAGCRLEAVAGRGGMGVVWRATQLALDRPVALKAMAPELAADAEFRERFQRESHLAASIEHPNVIPVYEAGELDGTLYLIMRWVDGTDLRELLSESGGLAPARALRLLRPVALALAAAHRRGLVHRDVKPANVLIARGEEEHVYLTDFGIARLASGEGGMTKTGVLVGTLDYTAPERFEGARGDASSDIYAFGCMLYQTLTGKVPYDRPTDVSKMFAHINDPIPSARDGVRGVPPSVDQIIARAMAKRPEDRFPSAGELAAALAKSLDEISTTEIPTRVHAPTTVAPAAPPPAPPEAAPPPAARTALDDRPRPATTAVARPAPSRRRLALAGAAAVIVAGAIVAVVVASGGGGTSTTRVTTNATTNSGPPSQEASSHTPGITVAGTTALPGVPVAITAGDRYTWVTLANSGRLFRLEQANQHRFSPDVGGRPTAIASALSGNGVWLAGSSYGPLTLIHWQDASRAKTTPYTHQPTALAVDPADGSVWAIDAAGEVGHVGLDGLPLSQTQVPGAIGVAAGGGGAAWVVDGKHLFRVAMGGVRSSYGVGPSPVSVALDKGVWTVGATGEVTRFNPITLAVSGSGRIGASELDMIAAAPSAPSVWAVSGATNTLYRIDIHGTPTSTGTVTFKSKPVALAATLGHVWVATQDGRLVQISST